ncbi:MAG: hypothetical protein NZ824_04750 [Candidatus Thioglobus sp.]|nr:hypothetical protein [Candidatus Thioglobus sp.]
MQPTLNIRCAIESHENEGYIVTRYTDSYIVMYYADDLEWTDNPPKFKKYIRAKDDYTYILDTNY